MADEKKSIVIKFEWDKEAEEGGSLLPITREKVSHAIHEWQGNNVNSNVNLHSIIVTEVKKDAEYEWGYRDGRLHHQKEMEDGKVDIDYSPF